MNIPTIFLDTVKYLRLEVPSILIGYLSGMNELLQCNAESNYRRRSPFTYGKVNQSQRIREYA